MKTTRTLRITALTIAVAAATAVLLPASASAAPPTRHVNTVTELSCSFRTTTSETAAFQASSSTDDATSGSMFLVEDQDYREVLHGSHGSAIFGPKFAATIVATRFADEVPVGTATLTADIAESTPVVTKVDDRDGNIRTTGTITTTDYVFTNVAASVPGFTLIPDAAACGGRTTVFDLTTTNPPVHVVTSTTFDSDICAVAGMAPALVRLSGETRTAPYAEVVIDEGIRLLKARGDVAMRGYRGSLRAPLEDRDTGDAVAQLTLGLRLTRTDRPTTTVTREERTVTIRTTTPYRAAIAVSTTDRRRGQVSCPAVEVRQVSLTFRR